MLYVFQSIFRAQAEEHITKTNTEALVLPRALEREKKKDSFHRSFFFYMSDSLFDQMGCLSGLDLFPW